MDAQYKEWDKGPCDDLDCGMGHGSKMVLRHCMIGGHWRGYIKLLSNENGVLNKELDLVVFDSASVPSCIYLRTDGDVISAKPLCMCVVDRRSVWGHAEEYTQDICEVPWEGGQVTC